MALPQRRPVRPVQVAQLALAWLLMAAVGATSCEPVTAPPSFELDHGRWPTVASSSEQVIVSQSEMMADESVRDPRSDRDRARALANTVNFLSTAEEDAVNEGPSSSSSSSSLNSLAL